LLAALLTELAALLAKFDAAEFSPNTLVTALAAEFAALETLLEASFTVSRVFYFAFSTLSAKLL